MTSLMDIHGSLSRLSFAVKQNLEPLPVTVIVEWHPTTYLSVVIECYGKHTQIITDRLMHGVLQGDYDYRFRSVSKPLGIDDYAWTVVRAYPDLQHVTS